MKNPILMLAAVALSFVGLSPAEAVDQRENVQNYIASNDFVVDICVYEQEWIPATEKFPKGKLVRRAVVTGVHKGDIALGTKLEFFNLTEGPQLFRAFRSVVEGELRKFFFSKSDGTLKNGKFTIEGDAHLGFDRLAGDFAEAFAKELKTNPTLKRQRIATAVPHDGCS